MTYKKVTPISKGVLRIRSEPDESGRVCGSVSYGEEVGHGRNDKGDIEKR